MVLSGARLALAAGAATAVSLALAVPASAAAPAAGPLRVDDRMICDTSTGQRMLQWTIKNPQSTPATITAINVTGSGGISNAEAVPSITPGTTQVPATPGVLVANQRVKQDAPPVSSASLQLSYRMRNAANTGDEDFAFLVFATAVKITCSVAANPPPAQGGSNQNGNAAPGAPAPGGQPGGPAAPAADAAAPVGAAPAPGAPALAEVPAVDLPGAGQPPLVDVPAAGQAQAPAGQPVQAATNTLPVSGSNASLILFGASGVMVAAGTVIFLAARRRRHVRFMN